MQIISFKVYAIQRQPQTYSNYTNIVGIVFATNYVCNERTASAVCALKWRTI